MSTRKYKDFSPDWYIDEAPPRSYRSIYKWGDPRLTRYRENLFKYVKELFKLSNILQRKKELGLKR